MAMLLQSCSRFLDAKPDQALAIPDQVRDLVALLDYEDRMNLNWPAAGDIAATYYYLNEVDWQARSIDVRNTYVWDDEAQNREDWSYSYLRIFYCNEVLDGIDIAKLGNLTEVDRKEVKGRAYFYRGFTFMQLAQLYCPYYAKGDSDSEYGLPLKIKSDINEPIVRSTLEETYIQIISDLSKAVDLLPVQSPIATRPDKTAALAALSRLYLIIGDYKQSLFYAEESLKINSTLIDYRKLDPSVKIPFKILNEEVVFHAVTLGTSGVHLQSRSYVDSVLVQKYDDGDLRKSIFFTKENDGQHRFKGGYQGSVSSVFAGIARDELYLIKAECLTRLGRIVEALATLNALLVKRWTLEEFKMQAYESDEELIKIILEERKKQLVFRGGVWWSDYRRLNKDSRFARSLKRKMFNVDYELLPKDLRYTFLLPYEVVEMNGLKQNPR